MSKLISLLWYLLKKLVWSDRYFIYVQMISTFEELEKIFLKKKIWQALQLKFQSV